MISDDDLKAIEELAAMATDLPWESSSDSGWDCVRDQGGQVIARLGLNYPRNADYIATACNLAPRLVAEIRRLRAAIREHRDDTPWNLVSMPTDRDRELWSHLESREGQ